MALLVLFALVAGAATAITPCVLPVLPALLSASATGGRRRPLGIATGLAVTFTVSIAALATVIDGVGLADGAVRGLAIAVLLAFGVVLAVPAVAARLEAPLSRLARFGPKTGGDGFWSGLVVGGALGFVYAPCAGPILAAVVSVSAAQGASAEIVAVAIAYGMGSAGVLLAMAYGGRRVLDRVRRAGRGPGLQRALGAVMVLTAVAMAAELDVRFQTALASEFPSVLTNPTRAIERSDAVEGRLADLRGEPRFAEAPGGGDPDAIDASSLKVLGTAPDFAGNDRWFNTAGGAPLSLQGLRGRVVLVDFWTYTCINCIRTLPYLKAWDRRYRDKGLTIVGVHTPEFPFERDADNVHRAIAQNGLRYPVAQDNAYTTWNAWGNQYWPAKYLIDAQGQVRYAHFGEGGYKESERAIRALLADAGGKGLGGLADARVETADPGVRTPETYLGSKRADGFLPVRPRPGTRRYPGARRLPPNHFALGGIWRVTGEDATAVQAASLAARFAARKVFLVLGSRGRRPRDVRVLLDGRSVRASEAGEDVKGGTVTVDRERLYRLVSLPRAGDHRLELRLPPGVTGYAFTFG
ncbi:MAG: cytochrome c biogenesis protein DipZ [Actinomycetota bacterium]